MPRTRNQGRASAARAKHELYEDLIIGAAERVFAERSFDSAKIQEIAQEAGLAPGTLYKIFPGKAEIFRTIHERRSRDLLAACEAALVAGAPPLARLLAFVAAYLEFLVAHPDYLRMHLGDASAWGFGERFESHVQARAWRRGHEVEVGLFEEGIEDGVFVRRDPSLLVRMMAAIQQVQLAHWVEEGMEQAPETLLAGMREDLVRSFCQPAVVRWLSERSAAAESAGEESTDA
jgi:AcrR family transcriptional regulator